MSFSAPRFKGPGTQNSQVSKLLISAGTEINDLAGHCGDNNLKYTAAAGGDLVIDVIIIILPMPVLWALQLRMAKKIALMAVFALGFL
jgi:hypothetical protein